MAADAKLTSKQKAVLEALAADPFCIRYYRHRRTEKLSFQIKSDLGAWVGTTIPHRLLDKGLVRLRPGVRLYTGRVELVATEGSRDGD